MFVLFALSKLAPLLELALPRAREFTRSAKMHEPSLARVGSTTHVTVIMQTLSEAELVGFLELKVGSLAVQVPIRAADPKKDEDRMLPLASFAVEGDACAILIRGEPSSALVERAVREAATDAERHLSRKLLN